MLMIFLVGFLGLSFGSFINALVWRIYQQSLPKKRRVANDHDLAISTGRSMCVNCQHVLGSLDLIPLFSWLYLRGRCRYCNTPISKQYPLVEFITSVLFVVSYIFWPYTLDSVTACTVFGLWLMTLVGMVALALYDFKWMLLPNRILFPLIGLQSVSVLVQLFMAESIVTQIGLLAACIAISSGLFYLLFQISDGRWIGGGDVKLGILLGLILMTPNLAFLMLFLASIIGLLFAIPLPGNIQSSKRVIPFGPALMIATFVCLLWGPTLINWYTNQFLYL